MRTKFYSEGRPRLQLLLTTGCVGLLLLLVSVADAAKVEEFIPKESVLYLKLQDLDEVFGEIDTSENWEKALRILEGDPDQPPNGWQNVQQQYTMIQGVLGTDLMGLLETVGYRTAGALWLDAAVDVQGGIVIHSGGNLPELQRLTKIVEGLLGLDGGIVLRLDAGVYQRVRYNALEMGNTIIKYGFIDEVLVIGIGEGSFEKLLDTYKIDGTSIEQSEEFAEAVKKMGAGEVTVFSNPAGIMSVMEMPEDGLGERLPIFRSAFAKLNLLESGAFLQVAVEVDPEQNHTENEIGMFLKKGESLETVKALSGKDDLFVAVAPGIVEGAWDLAFSSLANENDDDVWAGITLIEGLLNLDLEEDVRVGLTGELALSVPDLTIFEPNTLENFDIQLENGFVVNAEAVDPRGVLIFNPSHQAKWAQVGNSLSNLQNASTSQTEYNGVTVSGFGSGIYYAKVDGLFLIGFSEEEVYVLIDKIKQKPPDYLKEAPKRPAAFVGMNFVPLLLNQSRPDEWNKGPLPADKLIVSPEDAPRLLTWLSVAEDRAVLDIMFSEKAAPIETLSKLFPFLVWSMGID